MNPTDRIVMRDLRFLPIIGAVIVGAVTLMYAWSRDAVGLWWSLCVIILLLVISWLMGELHD